MTDTADQGRCRGCKFWGPVDPDYYRGTAWEGLGKCGAVLPHWDFTDYDDDSGEQVLTAEGKTKRAFVRDGSGYMATLLCRPDFGCVEFVAKGSALAPAVSEPTVPDGAGA